jgi:2-dehydropantoate 2-reductase
MLARAGAPVTLIGRPPHVQAITRHGLFFDGLHFQQQIPVLASTQVSAVRDADIVLFSVKTLDTEEAAKSLLPHLAPSAAVISLQNGVDNVQRIRAAKIDAFAAVVYVAAAMTAPGRIKHSGRGDLILGDLPGRAQEDGPRRRRLESIALLFERAGVPCRVSENVEGELWAKMILNCAYNPVSALGRAQYYRAAGNRWARAVMVKVIEEARAVARAAGVRLPEVNLVETVLEISESMASATSSMAQDLARGKRTEIDSLNGYLARRGSELGIATPFNQTLHALIKLLEESVQPNSTSGLP